MSDRSSKSEAAFLAVSTVAVAAFMFSGSWVIGLFVLSSVCLLAATRGRAMNTRRPMAWLFGALGAVVTAFVVLLAVN